MSLPLPFAEEAHLKALPKAEVHLHLEGCFEAALIAQWAHTEGVALPCLQEDLFKFSGLADFLGFLDLACGLARTRERLVELSYGLSQLTISMCFRPCCWRTRPNQWSMGDRSSSQSTGNTMPGL